MASYSVRLDKASTTVTYVGKAAVGASENDAVWQIKRLTVAGDILKVEFVDGKKYWNSIWANRASLSYS